MTYFPTLFGMGGYVPDTILTNADLSQRVDTNDEWIVSRTGIRERHIIAPGQNNSDMAREAGEKALREAGVSASELTHLFVATCTPDSACPPTACVLSEKLGCLGVFAMDLNAACSGFVYGLTLARDILAGNPAAKILLIGSDAMTTRVNALDRSTCVLFGDGAGAAVLGATEAARPAPGTAHIRDARVSSDGRLGGLLRMDGGGTSAPYTVGSVVGPEFFLSMQGREVFKHAVRNMAAICQDMLERNGLGVNDVDLLIPHQANLRIIEAVGSRLDIGGDRVFVNVDTHGNTSAASIPLALAEAYEKGRITPGMRVMVSTFGGGLTWGAALLEF